MGIILIFHERCCFFPINHVTFKMRQTVGQFLLTLVARFPDYSGFTYSVLWADPGPVRIPGLPCTFVFNLYFNRSIVITITNNAKQILKSRLRTGNNQFHWLPGQGCEISDYMSRKWLTVNKFGDRKCFLEDFEAD